MKTILEWKRPEELPDRNDTILVFVSDRYSGEHIIYTSRSIKNRKIDFLGNIILAWCYIDMKQLNNNLANFSFDEVWVEKLHDNAIKH